MRSKWPLILGLAVLGACKTPEAPTWTADYLFPLDFPGIDLSGVPGGIIPVTPISFTTPVEVQNATGLVGEILANDDLEALRAEIIVLNTLDITGTLDLSIAPAPGALFDPAQSLTANLSVQQGVDTSFVSVVLAPFRDAATLYFQSTVNVAGASGGVPVGPGDMIDIRVNFIGTVRVVP